MHFAFSAARRVTAASAAAILTVACVSHAGAADEKASAPPGYTMERTGSERDFAYFEGGWTSVQRKLKTRGQGADDWEEFPGRECMSLYLGGIATVDELYFPTLGRGGLTLRTFDREKRQWSIYWVNSQTGRLDPIPTVGGFKGDRGEFYAADTVGGRPVKVRYLWLIKDKNNARWEQAFSYDDKTWETNWTADFTRGDAADLCENGKTRR